MLLEETEVFLDLTKGGSHTLKNLGVAYLSLYLNHDKFVLNSAEELLDTPGCKSENVLVSGVANTARHLLLLIDSKHPLLGHRAGCLSGTKEVSPWTQILEVTFPDALAAANDLLSVQESLGFLHKTLETPFVGHNQRKIRQEALKLGLLSEHKLRSQHVIRRYIHGLYLEATDIILYGMLAAKLHSLQLSISQLQQEGLTRKWFDRMVPIVETVHPVFLDFLREKVALKSFELGVNKILSKLTEKSDDILNSNLKDADKTLISKLDTIAENYQYCQLDDIPVPWDSLSDLLKPQRNSKNNTNKMCQLQSILAGVHLVVNHLRTLNLSKISIVDFCSGAGHLGIFLAHHFLDCQIILVETKWGSLRYAKERVDKLGLTNVTLCLAHMEQFIGKFEVGVSLHACGSATDIVLQHCVRSHAAVVSSPCCYGKIVNSDTLSYPKSERFQRVIHRSDDYFTVSRLADHNSNSENYMKCVDIDRIEHLSDCGYEFASISKLKPLTCSPKNNLIVAFK